MRYDPELSTFGTFRCLSCSNYVSRMNYLNSNLSEKARDIRIFHALKHLIGNNFRTLYEMVKKLFLTLCFAGGLLAAAIAGSLYYLVVVEPGEEIQRENIKLILGKESGVFYSDGVTRLGVFFDTAHRKYVHYSEIPTDFINALIAAEDARFFEHFGFDPVGIIRAMVRNIQAKRIVQGGSTLTQQTAKNLFKRSERSFEEKLKELLFALRLEYHYSKKDILEFYANQFYVSGNGHGLGVAARYYFDKTPAELTLIECAFIAGSVKRPNYYNPFRKKTEAGVALAHERAQIRLKYVLAKMYEEGMIDTDTYNSSLAKQLVFTNGKVGYALDSSMELVREAVSSTEVREALEEHGITNIATSGVKIVTTIDKGLQDKTLSALRGELSRLDVRMRGFNRTQIQEEYEKLNYTGDDHLVPGAYLFGVIESISGKDEDLQVKVTLDKQLGSGIISFAGLQKLLLAYVKCNKNRWGEIEKGDLKKFLGQIQPGDRVWVSVTEIGEDGSVGLELEKYPLLQGGVIVLRDGHIRAMAGGTENRFFNRAVNARRSMGSAFKPLVFAAARQLGWSAADLLSNQRSVFVYHGMPYFPRPDHKSPHEWVSMSWAGVHSENLASVWLVARLCDKLSPAQFREVAERMDLTPRMVEGEEEPYKSYRRRIRDKYGIQVTTEILRKTACEMAIKNLETDFIFDGMMDEYAKLTNLPYGYNFEQYRKQLDKSFFMAKRLGKQSGAREYRLRRNLLQINYLQLEKLADQLEAYKFYIETRGERLESDSTSGGLYIDNNRGVFCFLSPDSDISGVVRVPDRELRQYLRNLDSVRVAAFWDNVLLEGVFSASAIRKLRTQLEKEYEQLKTKLPFEFAVLRHVADYRMTVGLFYLRELCCKLGITSQLEAVLSFPLGSNVVTLLEATRMYEGLVTGDVTVFEEAQELEDGLDSESESIINNDLAILDRIETAEGKILYQAGGIKRMVIGEETRTEIGSILENVVKFGTGRRANKAVRFAEEDGSELNLPMPLLGKTGTANNYTNASFFGFVPEVDAGGENVKLTDGYAVGAYVGFDDNHPMRNGTTRISGAGGALPVWCEIANALLEEKGYGSRLDPVDLSFYGLGIKRKSFGQINLAVDVQNGGKVISPAQEVSAASRMQPSIIAFGKVDHGGGFTPARNYQPFWAKNLH